MKTTPPTVPLLSGSSVGSRNRNYLNVKNNRRDPWQGSVGTDAHGHAIFSRPEYGLRAAIMTLRTYWFAHGLKSIAAILARWAPADDTVGSIAGAPLNSPREYAAFVCGRMRLGPNDDLALFHSDGSPNNMTNLQALIGAMAEFENRVGFHVPDDEFHQALYLVDPAHGGSQVESARTAPPLAFAPAPVVRAAAASAPVEASGPLNEIRAQQLQIPVVDLGSSEHHALAIDLQSHLIRLGFLEPPADGRFGPLSRHALEEFQMRIGKKVGDALDAATAQELLVSSAERFLPMAFDQTLASRLLKYMRLNQLWFSRMPGQINIIYLEGADENGRPIENRPNEFNDRRLVVAVEEGKAKLLGNWEGTTEPGKYWTEHPMNSKGAARIAFGQYKAWSVGFHHANDPKLRHEALVQTGTIKIYRDLNQDYQRTGDKIDEGDSFAVNQHWGYDNPRDNLGRSSAGCLVGRTKNGHREFMELVKTDLRYQNNHAYEFITTMIPAEKFALEVV